MMASTTPTVYVTRKGTEQPVGYIMSTNNGTSTVRWGVSDGKDYDEDIPTDELSQVEYKILSPEEVQTRQALEAKSKLNLKGDE
jgi:hypothetical protein